MMADIRPLSADINYSEAQCAVMRQMRVDISEICPGQANKPLPDQPPRAKSASYAPVINGTSRKPGASKGAGVSSGGGSYGAVDTPGSSGAAGGGSPGHPGDGGGSGQEGSGGSNGGRPGGGDRGPGSLPPPINDKPPPAPGKPPDPIREPDKPPPTTERPPFKPENRPPRPGNGPPPNLNRGDLIRWWREHSDKPPGSIGKPEKQHRGRTIR